MNKRTIFSALIIFSAWMIEAGEAAKGSPPVVKITSPKSGELFEFGAPVNFVGSGTDLADGKISTEKLVWTSDVDGVIGTGGEVTTSKLTAGSHIISIEVVNSKHLRGNDSVFVRVKKPKPVVEKPVVVKEKTDDKAKAAEPKIVESKTVKPKVVETIATPPAKQLGEKISVCYGPFRDKQNPDMGVFPETAEIAEDINFMAKFARGIRTYGAIGTPKSIPSLCDNAEVECFIGAWLGKETPENDAEIQALISISVENHKSIKALIVGNEVLLRKDMSRRDLADRILSVKAKTTLPVTTADTWVTWLKNPMLAEDVDFITIHVHPYWESVDIRDAASHVVEKWKLISKVFKNKRVVIGETGWPSEGQANGKSVPSAKNQLRFFNEFTQLAKENGIEYFWFSMYDENWKGKFEGKSGAHWGLFNSDGSLKPSFKGILPELVNAGTKRLTPVFKPLEVESPVLIYGDIGTDNKFQPSGYMGDIDAVVIDRAWKDNPHWGSTCTKVTYDPEKQKGGNQNWAAVYWQYPINNWGDYPGIKVKNGNRVSFWARGEKGNESVIFKAGGINDGNKEFKDSFGPLTSGVTHLTKEWKYYFVELNGADTSSVIGAFCWATVPFQTSGFIFYLDDIMIEANPK